MDYNKVEVADNMKVAEKVEIPVVKPAPVLAETPNKKKPGLFRRFFTGVMGPEDFKSIVGNVYMNTIEPSVKRIVVDSLISIVKMSFYKDDGPVTVSSFDEPVRTVSSRGVDYRSKYDSDNVRVVKSSRSSHHVEDYIIPNKSQAVQILFELKESAKQFTTVSLSEYYDKIRVPTTFSDNNFGWTYDTIQNATLLETRDGYIIRFPRLQVLD